MENKTILKITLGFFLVVLIAIGVVLADAVTVRNDIYHQASAITETPTYQQYQPTVDKDEEEREEENDEDDLSKEELVVINTEITQQQAIAIALELIDGEVTDIEIERKKGHEVYSVEIDDDGDEVDVFVDVKTGQIIGTELDSEEDEEDEEDDD
ncbi:PepSY domain-containing protein [Candidatus Woesearchaeota archaeon]|nr:PepSY domain-containing protein [Candidatus Woesearchaeota archaeon]